jgi:hypothetical protein
MTTFDVDTSNGPRSYRIRGRETDVVGGSILLAVLGVPLVWTAVAYGSSVIAMLTPRVDGDLPWIWWGLSQLVFASVVLVWSALSIVWVLAMAVVVIAVLVPGYSVWRIDGAGLSCIGAVGPFTSRNAFYVPFEAIAQIQLYKTEVMLHVWRGGVAHFERTIAMDLSVDDAKRLAAMLTEDFAAAAREWEAQGLRINRRAVNYGT